MNKNKLKNKINYLRDSLTLCLNNIKNATDTELLGIIKAINAIHKSKKVLSLAKTKIK